MAVISTFFQSQVIEPFSIELLNSIVKGKHRNFWSSSSTLGGILSGPSELVGLSVLSLLKTAAGEMTTSVKHHQTPSELLAQFSAGILSNVSFKKQNRKINLMLVIFVHQFLKCCHFLILAC